MSQQAFCHTHNQTEGQSVFFRPMEPHTNTNGSLAVDLQIHAPLLTKRRSQEVSLPPLPLLDPKRTKLSHSE